MMQLFQTLGMGLLFLIMSVGFFYLPGFGLWSWWLKRPKIGGAEALTLSYGLGMVIVVGLAFLLAALHLRNLLGVIILVIDLIVGFKMRSWYQPFIAVGRDKVLMGLLLLGLVMLGSIDFFSGYRYGNGLLFWSSQGFDGFWHLALINSIKQSLPPQHPVYAGEQLYNYHYLADVVMAEFSRVCPWFGDLDLYYRFFPVLWCLVLGWAIFGFVQRWQKSALVGYLAIWMTFFVGSFGYVVTWFKSGRLFAGETTFWASQLNTILGNPPHTTAMILMLGCLITILWFLETKQWRWLVVGFGLVASLGGFKVSGGVVLLLGLGAMALLDLWRRRRWEMVGLTLALGLTNFLTIKALTRGAEGFLIWMPWWFVRTMIVDGGRVGWMDLELRREYYASLHTFKGDLRVLQFELMALTMYVVGNSGVRIIGFWELGKGWWKRQVDVFVVSAVAVGFGLPMLFLQKGIAYNSIQFMQYYLLFLGFLAAITIGRFLQSRRARWLKVMVMVVVISLGLPTVIGNLVEFYGPGRAPLAIISNSEISALDYLKANSQPNQIVLTLPFDQYLKDHYDHLPLPIFAWYSTAYVGSLANLQSFFASEDMVSNTNFPQAERYQAVNQFFKNPDPVAANQFLRDNHISYIYLPKGEDRGQFLAEGKAVTKIFENSEVLIYQVKP